jgi:hypothetical protein
MMKGKPHLLSPAATELVSLGAMSPFEQHSNAAEVVVAEFWRLMATNDFHAVSAVLSNEFVLEWPQSKERIRGAENFAKMTLPCFRWMLT